MQRLNLARVDNGFAVKSQFFDYRCFRNEAFFVVHVGINRVQRGNARCPCRIEYHAAGKKQLNAVRTGGFKVGDIILRAEGDSDKAIARFCNCRRIQHAVCRLNSRHHACCADGNARFLFNALNLAFAVDNILCTVRLRQANDLHAGADNGLKVRNPESA